MKEIKSRWYLLKRDDVQEMPIEAMMDMLLYGKRMDSADCGEN